jgi:anaerobic ribonucleoside-triphosphate reductase activating protein
MLKYLNTQVTFAEVPDEITLCINITGCKNGCKNCHSSYLAEDIGKPLNWDSLNVLIYTNTGISCVAFMGGDNDPKAVSRLAEKVKSLGLKTAWYSGRQELSKDINLEYFDYIKLGPYMEEFGPLNSRTTNQRMYKVHGCDLEDITSKFWKE